MADVVFVGLGFGGLYTLREFMDDVPDDVRVTAIDRRDRFVFTPLLYEYLAGELDPGVVAPELDGLLPDGPLERLRAEVTSVDIRGRRLELADGETLSYDAIVLSPGSRAAYHDVPGAREKAIPFYSFRDARRLRAALVEQAWVRGSEPAVVVGGGVVGIELAFALAEFLERRGQPAERPRVIVLEALDDILRGMSDGLTERARGKLRKKGIEVRTGVRVLEVEEGAVRFEEGDEEQRLDVPIVAWTAGIRPSPLLDQLPAERHGPHGVRVERTLQLPAFPYAYVVGDAISYPGRAQGNPLPDTAQAAVQQSEACARNVQHWLEEHLAQEQYSFQYMGEFLRVSRNEAVGSLKGVVLDGRAGAIARRAAYLARLPAWAIRTSAFRQWLGG